MTVSFSAILKWIEKKLHVVNRVSFPTSQTTLEVVDVSDGRGHH
jgi:hypothetical protein